MKKSLIASILLSLAFGWGSLTGVADTAQNGAAACQPRENFAASSVVLQQNENSIMQSYNNGETWQDCNFNNDFAFFSYDEYAKWIETESESIYALVEAGEWTQEQADTVISKYQDVLAKVKSGLMVSKREHYNDAQILFRLPESKHTEDFQAVVYDGTTFECFGPFETQQELYAALTKYTEAQIQAGSMTPLEVAKLLAKYR